MQIPHLRFLLLLISVTLLSYRTDAAEPASCTDQPARIVVLTFDDSVKSHFTVASPILKKYGFGASFFITEGFTFKTNKEAYMTWDEIKQLHDDGFEIGNHTRDHLNITDKTYEKLDEQLTAIEQQCHCYGIPKPVSFAWPGNAITAKAIPILQAHGIRYARRGTQPEFAYEAGRGLSYEPDLDHPLLIPTTGDARPAWKLDNFLEAISKAEPGKICVLQFHGVPDIEHPWVHTPEEQFEIYMRTLKEEGFTVIALRDIEKYADLSRAPCDPWHGIRVRLAKRKNDTQTREEE